MSGELSPDLDAACVAFWNDMHADGWSWREMIEGRAGNDAKQRQNGQDHALRIAHAIQAAITASTNSHPDDVTRARMKKVFNETVEKIGISREAHLKKLAEQNAEMLAFVAQIAAMTEYVDDDDDNPPDAGDAFDTLNNLIDMAGKLQAKVSP